MGWLEVLLMQYRQQYLRNSLGTELKIETVLEEHVLRPPLVAFLLCTEFFIMFCTLLCLSIVCVLAMPQVKILLSGIA